MILLKPITKEEFYSIKKLSINHEEIEDCFKKYTHGFLDVYDHCLTPEEADKLINSFGEHNLKYEDRFVEFMQAVYKMNKIQPVVVEFHMNGLSNIELVNILSCLDYKDKLLFIDQIRYLNGDSNMFLVEDEEIITLLTKLSTRELIFSIFHFIRVPVSVCGNFDLSFPMFFAGSDGLYLYKDMARECSLHIRDIKIMEDKYEME
ncbi:hypothetical protein SAMN05443428_10326 [Caloramator quimbayensis]|uniref:DUF3885 domain-containing protein n=2 Tax=Caloramator quimbayensis TaxID=1147123 RepID=A0A1T4WQ82_9CLOT|nr:hypothetical protein SAMN05443428_10326 [Caloramator quimbayensis]